MRQLVDFPVRDFLRWQPSASHAAPSRACTSSSGFTLVETLVALTIVGMMSTMVVGMYARLGSLRETQIQYEREAEAEAVSRYLASEIGAALALPIIDPTRQDFRPMTGASNSLRFVAVVRTGFDEERLRDIEISWSETGGQSAGLWRRASPRRATEHSLDETSARMERIDAAITRVTFSYCARGEDADRWLSEWAGKTLPAAVKVTVEVDGPNAAQSAAIARLP